MQRTSVASSDIRSVGYDASKQQLEIEFQRGNRLYVYDGVPLTVYQGLMSAASKGVYFAAFIKGKYEFTARSK